MEENVQTGQSQNSQIPPQTNGQISPQTNGQLWQAQQQNMQCQPLQNNGKQEMLRQYAQNANTSQPKKKKKKWWIPIIVIVLILAIAFGVLYFFFRDKLVEWTDGAIGTVSVNSVNLDEAVALTEPKAPSERQIRKVEKYAENVYVDQCAKLTSDERVAVTAARSAVEGVVEAQLSGKELTVDLLSEIIERKYDEIEKDNAVKLADRVSLPEKVVASVDEILDGLSVFEVKAYAAETLSLEDILNCYTYHNLAVAMSLKGAYEDALAMESLACVMNPYSPEATLLMGNLMKQEGLDYDAVDMMLFSIEQNPENEPAWVSLGNLYLDMGKYDDAEKCFNRAFAITQGSGPANQGMMLVYLAKNDINSAFLYMLEGAKEGYTTTITLAYNHFVKLFKNYEDYLDWVGPILESYGVQNMMDFKRARNVFDPTLDTPGQQLNLDRNFHLPDTASEVINSTGSSLSACFSEMKFYLKNVVGDVDLNSIINEDGSINFDALRANSTISSFFDQIGIDPEDLAGRLSDAASHVDEDGNVDLAGLLGALKGNDKKEKSDGDYTVTDDMFYQDNYEQEEFWLSVLADYYFYEFYKLVDKYYTKPSEKHMEGAITTVMQHSVDLTEGLSKQNPMESLFTLASGLISNGSLIGADESFTAARIKEMTELFCPMNDYIEKGYSEAVILAEEYWLYSNNILGYIADDSTYNKQHQKRNALVTNISRFFPFAGASANAMIGALSSEWAGMTFDVTMNELEFDSSLHKYFSAKLDKMDMPALPDYPITGMGTAVKPPLKIRVEVPGRDIISTDVQNGMVKFEGKYITGGGITYNPQTGAIHIGGMGTVATSPATTDDKPGNDEPEPTQEPQQTFNAPVYIDPFAEAEDVVKPMVIHNEDGSETVIQRSDAEDWTFGIKIKGLIDVGVNTTTGDIKISLGGIIGGGGISYEHQSGDLSLFASAGIDAALGVNVLGGGKPTYGNQGSTTGGSTGIGDPSLSLNLASGTAQFKIAMTVNTRKKQITSAGVQTEIGTTIGDRGVLGTVGYDILSSAKVETVKVIIDGASATTTMTTPIK